MSQEPNSHLIDRAAIAIDHATERAAEQTLGAAQRGVAAMRSGTQHVRDSAQHASDSTVGYIREEPVKAMLIAAAAGAALMALAGLMARPRGDRS
jgi:ElaB/YqjD/DUF883 family membrane-anchored ribosome-binding protein